MADKKISEMPAAGSLTGSELVHVVQGGDSKRATVADVSPVRRVNGETGDLEVSDRVVDAGTVSTDYAINLGAAAVVKMTLANNVTLSVMSAPTARSRVVQVLVTASGARALAFASGWLWAGPKPTALAASAKGLLSLTSVGADIIASWQLLGDGS